MARWKHLLTRARHLAETHVPDPLRGPGRKLLDELGRLVPGPLADAIGLVPTVPEAPPETAPAAERSREAVLLERVRARAEHGLKPEDRLVVIYATAHEAEAVAEIRGALAGIETTVREMDLDKEPLQTRTQLARLTGAMVPPYVYVNGRYWGAQYEILSLRERDELEHVVANRLDLLGPEARRIGKLHDAWSDDITVGNILQRWRLGHILSVDDLDAWYEVDKQGVAHFFYQGGPLPVEEMEAAAREIEAGVQAGTIEARWLLEPAVTVGAPS